MRIDNLEPDHSHLREVDKPVLRRVGSSFLDERQVGEVHAQVRNAGRITSASRCDVMQLATHSWLCFDSVQVKSVIHQPTHHQQDYTIERFLLLYKAIIAHAHTNEWASARTCVERRACSWICSLTTPTSAAGQSSAWAAKCTTTQRQLYRHNSSWLGLDYHCF